VELAVDCQAHLVQADKVQAAQAEIVNLALPLHTAVDMAAPALAVILAGQVDREVQVAAAAAAEPPVVLLHKVTIVQLY
jgi:outer membrane biosynthesis protein TonB